MKRVTYYRWNILSDTIPGKRIKTTYHLTEEEAKARDPDASPIPGTEDVRELPETPEEREQARTLYPKHRKEQ